MAVTALTDARLLRLDQAPLFELLEDHPSVAWGIIQRLAQRLQRAGQGRAEQARADLLGGLRRSSGEGRDRTLTEYCHRAHRGQLTQAHLCALCS